MPLYKVRTGTQAVEVEASSRLSILERIADWNGIHVEEIIVKPKRRKDYAKRSVRQESPK
jgi:hypothetical protein